jgi:UDP-N-acetylglucosamine--N-acetylmuramyl-(pentapeptide) pyrophosphoryl-undecaprenol N-acetylglucosamine transferase
MNAEALHIIISGGGTGGHVFPALAIAEALHEINPQINILFVGATGRMEMQKVPEAGYRIVGLPVAGLQRRITWKNLLVPYKLIKSIRQSQKILREFKPDVAVGVGGYASGPVLRVAGKKGIPVLIQEQNSCAGVTNRLLARRAQKICVAYDGMEKYFPAHKIELTGNPVRRNLTSLDDKKGEGLEHFHLKTDRKTLLVIGGSQGARSINESMIQNLNAFENKNLQVIWQCGRNYYQQALDKLHAVDLPNIRLKDFISRIDLAYAASDLIISRAGAGTISELALIKKPVILVPSPNVAEDHQTRNARFLVKKNAAILVKDQDAREKLIDQAFRILDDDPIRKALSSNIAGIAKPDSAKQIAESVIQLAQTSKSLKQGL